MTIHLLQKLESNGCHVLNVLILNNVCRARSLGLTLGNSLHTLSGGLFLNDLIGCTTATWENIKMTRLYYTTVKYKRSLASKV